MKRIWLHMSMTLLLEAVMHIGEAIRHIGKREPANEMDKDAVTIMKSNSLGKQSVIRHIPQSISKFSTMFLMVQFTSIEVEVVGKRLNCGGGYGLEIQLNIVFRSRKDCPMVVLKIRNSKKRASI